MKNQINFSRNGAQDFDDMGGKHQAVYAGQCVVCGTRVFEERDYHGTGLGAVHNRTELGRAYAPDPRGIIGDHSASWLVASEYDMTGADVLTCFNCQNDHPRYERGLRIAKAQWH